MVHSAREKGPIVYDANGPTCPSFLPPPSSTLLPSLLQESSRFLVAFDASSEAATGGEQQQEQEQQQQAAAAAAAPGERNGTPLAYVNYRFEIEDDGAPVAYCYEVQLEAAAQRRGLGRHLMRLLELIVSKRALRALACCVFFCSSFSC